MTSGQVIGAMIFAAIIVYLIEVNRWYWSLPKEERDETHDLWW